MKTQKLTLESFFETTRKDVEQAILDKIKDNIMLSQLANGKKLRPLIAILSFKACTGGKEDESAYKRAVDGTVGIELAHTASLINDDIIDKDTLRRGKPSLYMEKGIETAILISQKMIAVGFRMAVERGIKFVELYVDTWNEALSGELLEIEINKRGSFSINLFIDTYFSIIEKKTASIFSSACKAGALEANSDEETIKIVGEYGREVGMAYQLADDLVDITNGESIISVILPLLNRIERIERESINGIKIEDIKKKIKDHEKEIKEFFINEIRRRINSAEDLIRNSPLPNSIYKELLLQAPRYIVNRMLKTINMVI